MTLQQILNLLSKNKISVRVENGEVNLLYNGNVPPDIVELIEREKESLRQIFSDSGLESVPVQDRKSLHDSGSRSRLSSQQWRLWLLQKQHRESSAYNIFVALGLRGELDRVSFEAAFRQLLLRHRMLRTVFRELDGEIFQKCNDQLSPLLDEIDFSNQAEANKVHKSKELLREFVRRPFDLNSDSLVRAVLVKLSDKSYHLSLVFHHLIVDGSSIRIILRDFFDIYRSHIRGIDPVLPEIKKEYFDYCALLDTDSEKARRRYEMEGWRTRIARAPSGGLIPANHRVNQSKAATTLEVREEIGELGARIDDQAKILGVTPYVIFLSALFVVVSRYTSQSVVRVATPVDVRPSKGFDNTVGYFANTVLIQCDLGSCVTFRDVVSNVSREVSESLSLRQTPFEDVVYLLGENVGGIEKAPVQILFSYQRDRFDRRSEPDASLLRVRRLRLSNPESRFELTVDIHAISRKKASVVVKHDAKLFDVKNASSFTRTYLQTLLAMVDDIEGTQRIYCACAKDDLHFISDISNGQMRSYPTQYSLDDLFEAGVAMYADHIAVTHRSTSLSYREFNNRVDQIAKRLRDVGVHTTSRVIICMRRGIDPVLVMFAVLRLGGTYIPVEPDFPESRLQYISADAAPAFAVLDTGSTVAFSMDITSVQFESLCKQGGESIDLDRKEYTDPELAAYIIYTSGSSGLPKGVQISHRSVVNLVYDMGERHSTKNLITASIASFSFDMSVGDIYFTLLNGGTLNIADGLSDWLDAIQRNNFTFSQAPASVWAAACAIPFKAVDAQIVSGGESLNREVALRLLATGARTWNYYGPTEACVWASCTEIKRVGNSDLPEITIGRPLSNVSIYLLDQYQQLSPIGAAGEIYIGGAGVGLGYINDRVRNEKSFVSKKALAREERLYRTGDYGRYADDGSIIFLGRIDNQIKSNGYRIDCGEIESAIFDIQGVRQCAVAPSVAKQPEGPTAFVAVNEGLSLGADDIEQALRKLLPRYMWPRRVVMVRELPRLVSGKVDFQSLFSLLQAGTSSDAAAEISHGSATETLRVIWKELLGIAFVETHSNFFESGGDSLLATTLVARVFDVLGVLVPLRSIFDNPTFDGMVRVIEEYLLTNIHTSVNEDILMTVKLDEPASDSRE